MITIAIIGTGMIGKRHLQSVTECFLQDTEIFAVDASETIITNLRETYNGKVTCFTSIDMLPKYLDIAVIATNSDIRRKIVEQLLKNSEVKYLILEKVLFQKEEDYYTINNLLNEKKTKTWVNCARRAWDSYQKIKHIFDNDKEMYINISGGEWGLGCNGIHMLDLVQFFSGHSQCKIDVSELEHGIIESKRKGFYEFYGSLKGSCGKCKKFQIRCTRGTSVPILIEVLTENKRVIIDETHNVIHICSALSGWAWEESPFFGEYQSQLTGKVIKQILYSGEAPLSMYQEAMELHLEYILNLTNYFKAEGMEGKLCPIT